MPSDAHASANFLSLGHCGQARHTESSRRESRGCDDRHVVVDRETLRHLLHDELGSAKSRWIAVREMDDAHEPGSLDTDPTHGSGLRSPERCIERRAATQVTILAWRKYRSEVGPSDYALQSNCHATANRRRCRLVLLVVWKRRARPGETSACDSRPRCLAIVPAFNERAAIAAVIADLHRVAVAGYRRYRRRLG